MIIRGCRGSPIRSPCGWGMPPRTSASSTSTARCWTRPIRRLRRASRAQSSGGRWSSNSWLADHWHEEDAGIWEVRGPLRDFTHSKMMAWVAFDRAVRIHDEFGRDGPVNRWRELRDEIKDQVLRCGWSERKQAFTQSRSDERRQHPAHADRRLPAGGRSTVRLDGRGDPTRAKRRRSPVRRSQDEQRVDGCRRAKASSWPARSGWSKSSPYRGDWTRPRRCSIGYSVCATTSGFSEEYDPKAGMLLGNFPKRSRTWHSSRPR